MTTRAKVWTRAARWLALAALLGGCETSVPGKESSKGIAAKMPKGRLLLKPTVTTEEPWVAPDLTAVLATGEDLRMFRLGSGRWTSASPCPNATMESLAFSSNGRFVFVVCAGEPRHWVLWQRADGRTVASGRGALGTISSDGAQLVVLGDDALSVIDTATGRTWPLTFAGKPMPPAFDGQTGPFWQVAAGPGGVAVVGDEDPPTLRLLRGGKQAVIETEGRVTAMAFRPRTKQLYYADQGGLHRCVAPCEERVDYPAWRLSKLGFDATGERMWMLEGQSRVHVAALGSDGPRSLGSWPEDLARRTRGLSADGSHLLFGQGGLRRVADGRDLVFRTSGEAIFLASDDAVEPLTAAGWSSMRCVTDTPKPPRSLLPLDVCRRDPPSLLRQLRSQ